MLTVPPVFVATPLVISERVAAESPDRTLAKSSAAGRKLRIRKEKWKSWGRMGAGKKSKRYRAEIRVDWLNMYPIIYS